MYKILRFLDHVLNHAELYKQNECFCDQSSFPALTCKSVRFLQADTWKGPEGVRVIEASLYS